MKSVDHCVTMHVMNRVCVCVLRSVGGSVVGKSSEVGNVSTLSVPVW